MNNIHRPNDEISATSAGAYQPSAVLPTASPSRAWLHMLSIAIVFVSGLIVGISGTLVSQHGGDGALTEPMPSPPAIEIARRITGSMKDRLGLTDEQAQKIQSIIEQRQTALLELRRELQPQVEEELAMMKQQIDEVLDDQQRKKWDEFHESLKKRFPRPPFGPSRGGHYGGGPRGGPKHGGPGHGDGPPQDGLRPEGLGPYGPISGGNDYGGPRFGNGGSGGGGQGFGQRTGAGPSIFEMLDKDDDGRLTAEEAGDRLRPRFDAVDTNDDGRIDSDEFREAMKEAMEKRPPLPKPGPNPRPGEWPKPPTTP